MISKIPSLAWLNLCLSTCWKIWNILLRTFILAQDVEVALDLLGREPSERHVLACIMKLFDQRREEILIELPAVLVGGDVGELFFLNTPVHLAVDPPPERRLDPPERDGAAVVVNRLDVDRPSVIE